MTSVAFHSRHIGPNSQEEQQMLAALGLATRADLVQRVIPLPIWRQTALDLPAALKEEQALARLQTIAKKNLIYRNFIGQGYYGTHTPTVILRNVLENPAWYTAYTPYQAEISQGRLEALVNFQTMVCDLTAMDIANASMLDEATAAAEAMTLAYRHVQASSVQCLVAPDCHPQTIAVLRTRATPLGIQLTVPSDLQAWHHALQHETYFAAIDQYPSSLGRLQSRVQEVQWAHEKKALYIVAADLLALTLLTPPGEWSNPADIVIGSTQRFGMPMGAGGPHAGFFACKEVLKRAMPGRLVGVSLDAHGNNAYRLALQTREQHIRREKATSNLCTAQVLPAIVASFYAIYHGQNGLKIIAERITRHTAGLQLTLKTLGFSCAPNTSGFDTLCIETGEQTTAIVKRALAKEINLRQVSPTRIAISLDETTTETDVQQLCTLFDNEGKKPPLPTIEAFKDVFSSELCPIELARQSQFLTHPVFNRYQSETAMLRYIRQLSDKDLALDRTMIPLGSCTMKLNASSEMIPITWPEFAQIHPFAPANQQQGFTQLQIELCHWLTQITGYAAISLQPNAGSQGEYAGLLIIQAYHRKHGQQQRNICLIPSSAHGTNPASAQMVGMEVVVVACDAQGNVDAADLQQKCETYRDTLAAVMMTYPSTHGVFETEIKTLCKIVHDHGGLVYIDGANMNAMVGLVAPGEIGGDVSHLNLHKTFCIPHGGGGPGVGPVCVGPKLAEFLPELPGGIGAISAAPLGNAAVLPISWMYCQMMGADGLIAATESAILAANYISRQLRPYFPTLYASESGDIAHECILDIRPIKEKTGISAEDVAKRLIDYGFHAPTLSFPVPGTLMIEPTESEPLAELNRFIAAMIAIRAEIREVEEGRWPANDNPLKNAPHTAHYLITSEWPHPYSRTQAAYPLLTLNANKYWAPVGRVDNVHGDRNLVCTCPPLSDYA